jgi:multicomponent Na+:H+ antiporter subunit G
MSEWIVFSFAAILIIGGLLVSLLAAFGLFKFRFALNRMHAAAMCDTLAILLVLLGLIVINGASFLTLKLGLIIVLLWFASPVSSHLLAHMEVIVSSKLKDNCELPGQEEGGSSES